MTVDFERVEDLHDLAAGMEYDAYRERISALREADADAYEIDDPKHPDHYETLVDIWDNREGK